MPWGDLRCKVKVAEEETGWEQTERENNIVPDSALRHYRTGGPHDIQLSPYQKCPGHLCPVRGPGPDLH
ncbi:hypothetical protein AAFF_G00130330 [Aldrovandia affinis]|uniref:Uncharacterized protein n=1 Tax=Aldrovandia affinis TaxID=143900 RepID=A0AAD7W9V9_9TELE|nr:hypothetical protein AAFF_G00130330 [Aldrovandia affinis]